MKWLLILVLVFGISPTVWAVAGLLRLVSLRRRLKAGRHRIARIRQSADSAGEILAPPAAPRRLRPNDVAVLIAAHNEQGGIGATVEAAHTQVPFGNVFVISDASSDATAERARAAGAQVLDLTVNRGKAGALTAGIAHFDLSVFEVTMFLDADTIPADDYMETGLPQFDDPEVIAVAGTAGTMWPSREVGVVGRILIAYRQRMYVLWQTVVKYGQASKWANSVSIVPGFASMYRTRVLSQIDITAPGLVIEDFNMTFEVHTHKLGRIAFVPGAARAFTQDPSKLPDYTKQVRRWTLGFWQTVIRHRSQRGVFWAALAIFILELVVSSVMIAVVLPTVVLVDLGNLVATAAGSHVGWLTHAAHIIPLRYVLIGVVLPDYLMTLYVASRERRGSYLWLGLLFPVLRVLDGVLCLRSLFASRFSKSNGVWKSPTRRALQPMATLAAPKVSVTATAGQVPRQRPEVAFSPDLSATTNS